MTSTHLENDLRRSIRIIPLCAKPRALFRAITALLVTHAHFAVRAPGGGAPGLGPLGTGSQEKGKLPHKRSRSHYSLEYGLDEMEMLEGSVEKGDRVNPGG